MPDLTETLFNKVSLAYESRDRKQARTYAKSLLTESGQDLSKRLHSLAEKHCDFQVMELSLIHYLQGAPHDDNALLALAKPRYASGKVEEAIGLLKDLSHRPSPAIATQANILLSHILLLEGRFAEGWETHEKCWGMANGRNTWRDFPQPRWQGQDLKGKTLLIWQEQGIGDEIMYAGIFHEILSLGATLVVECNEKLVPLYERSFPSVEVLASEEPPTALLQRTDFDYQIPVGSLPTHFRRTAEDYERATVPYLHPDPATTETLKAKYASETSKLIGISWRGGWTEANIASRCPPLDLWRAPLSLPDTKIVSLQYLPAMPELKGIHDVCAGPLILDQEIDAFADMYNFAAQVKAMDAVITVANTTAHMAGALNVPTIMIRPYRQIWAWPHSSTRGLWYPSLHIIEQTTPGDWEEPMTRARTLLEEMLGLPRDGEPVF